MYQIFIILFFIALISNLITELKINGDYQKPAVKYRWITKPLLTIFLVLVVITLSTEINWLLIVAILFGLLGDIFMMFDDKWRYYILGSLMFLFGHVFYIIIFCTTFNISAEFPWWRLLLFLPALSVFLFYAFPKINKKMPKNEEIPSIIYGGVLLLMAFLALFRNPLQNVLDRSFFFVWIGSQLFVISDAILSVNRFNKKFAYAMIYIMVTYGLAQFFIVIGLI